MTSPKEWQCTLSWVDPSIVNPPLNKPILVIVSSSVDRGRGFKPHYSIMTIKIVNEDPDGDRLVANEMRDELDKGESKWSDLQFRCVTTDVDDDLDFYSDSIKWWCEPPAIPTP
jgi:hypothetical protein